MSIEDEIIELKKGRLTIIESMKFLVHVLWMSLALAKERLASHPVWSGVVPAVIPLHEDIVKALK